MSRKPLALLLLLVTPLPGLAATLDPEVPVLSDWPHSADRPTAGAPLPPNLPSVQPLAGLSTFGRVAALPIAAAEAQPEATPVAQIVQLPLPGAMPLLLVALAGFVILGRRRGGATQRV